LADASLIGSNLGPKQSRSGSSRTLSTHGASPSFWSEATRPPQWSPHITGGLPAGVKEA